MWVPLSVLCVDCFAVSLWSLCSRGFIFGDKAWFFVFFVVVGFASIMSRSAERRVGRFACCTCFAVLRVDLKLGSGWLVLLVVVRFCVMLLQFGIFGNWVLSINFLVS